MCIPAAPGGPCQRIGSTSVHVAVHADDHLVQVPVDDLGDHVLPFAASHVLAVFHAVTPHATQVTQRMPHAGGGEQRMRRIGLDPLGHPPERNDIPSILPRVQEVGACRGKVGFVAGDDRKPMPKGGRGDQAVDG